MRNKDEVIILIAELKDNISDNYEFAKISDTSAGENHYIEQAENNEVWGKALEWVLNENKEKEK